MYGDNFYHKNENGDWTQENSAHSNLDGSVNQDHLNTDVGGKNVLIGQRYYYFGASAPLLPNQLWNICYDRQGVKKIQEEPGKSLITWLEAKYRQGGIYGEPANWVEYNQQTLF